MPIIPPHGTRDMRGDVLPPALLPIFEDSFVRSCDLIEEYIFRLAVDIFRRLGGESATARAGSVAEIIERCELDPQIAPVPVDWLARLLARRGLLEEAAGKAAEAVRYSLTGPLPENSAESIREQQEEHDPRALPSFDIARMAADAYPECLRGTLKGEQALFAPARLALWSKYFHNDNPLYAINNRIPAMHAAGLGDLAAPPARAIRSVLELGGGLGSAGVALLEALEEAGRLKDLERYRFTDVSPVFLRRGDRALRAGRDEGGGVTIQSSRVDIDGDLAAQLRSSDRFDLIFSVNTLHVAKSLEKTLRQILELLEPGGRLIFGECVRPFPRQPLYTELVFFLLESFRSPELDPSWRPTGGFLTAEQWTAALEHAGFAGVEVVPDIATIRPHYDNFVVASLSARRPG
ncbi:MAG: class I SAM-dependent methyltransferase [Acidobacteriota bacterium]